MPDPDQDVVRRAREFAITHHGDQKYGDQPYLVHLEEVATIVGEHAEAETVTEAIATAYLHDVVEDTAATEDHVRDEFGTVVAYSVGLVSDESGPNRKMRKRATYMKLRDARGTTDLIALLVKLADRVANVRSCVREGKNDLLKMYKREHEAFRLAVYRRMLRWEPLMNELDTTLG